MNKSDLAHAVAAKTQMTLKDTEKLINATFSAIEDALAKKDKVQLVGFGTFEVKDRGARKGRNPQTGKEITIAASATPVFKAGKGFKDAVNK